MATLKELTTRLLGNRAAQAPVVEEIEARDAPLRRLAELRAQEAELQAQEDKLKEQERYLNALIDGAAERLDYWSGESYEELVATHRSLQRLEAAVGKGFAVDGLTVYQVAKMVATIYNQIDQLATQRKQREQWVAERAALRGEGK